MQAQTIIGMIDGYKVVTRFYARYDTLIRKAESGVSSPPIENPPPPKALSVPSLTDGDRGPI